MSWKLFRALDFGLILNLQKWSNFTAVQVPMITLLERVKLREMIRITSEKQISTILYRLRWKRCTSINAQYIPFLNSI